MASSPNVNAANKYARDVVAGKVEACKWVRAACRRHLGDLEKAKKKTYRWKFDKAEAERVCVFIQLLPHTKGKWAGKKQLIALEPWQKFIFCCIFGWRAKRSGLRRFREVYCEIPRKNGKSVIAAGLGLFMFTMDGEFGAEVYCGATTEDQALEVFRPARLMLKNTPLLVEECGVELMVMNLSIPDDGSRFEPLIGDPGDGSSPSCAIVDEYHEHVSSALYDTMITGMGAREHPLMFVITTAGYNLAGPCYVQRGQVKDMLLHALGEGGIENEELFGIIYTIDEGDDWQDPKVLRKANPNYGVSVDDEYLLRMQANAKRYPSQLNKFKTKHLNVWVSSRSAWLNMSDWAACGNPDLTLEQFRGRKCWLGVDLASKSDMTAVALVFKDKDERGRDVWTVFCRSYLPEGAIERAVTFKDAYERWANTGELLTTDGEETDFDVIRDDIKDLATMFDIQEIAYDKWRATQLAQQLQEDGAEVVEVGGGIQTMNMPMREVEAALVSRRFNHSENAVLSWMAGNVTAKEYRGCLTPMKEDEGKGNLRKIDGMVAVLMAMSRAMLADYAERSLLDTLTDDDILAM